MSGVFPPKPNALQELFSAKKPIIGMVHLLPLPGSPRYGGSMAQVIDAALADAAALEAGGVSGLQIENAGDIPFLPPGEISWETAAAMAVVAQELTKATKLPVGINVLANGVLPALAVAAAAGLRWVRCNQWVNAYIANEGYVAGAAPQATRYRARLKAEHVKIFADVHVKHGAHAIVADRSIREQAADAEWFDADVLIATGTRTGGETEVAEVEEIRRGTVLPVIIGSGLTPENAPRLLRVADGAIVGSYVKVDGKWWNPVDVDRVRRLMDAVAEVERA